MRYIFLLNLFCTLGKIPKFSAAATNYISKKPEEDEFTQLHQHSVFKIAIKSKV